MICFCRGYQSKVGGRRQGHTTLGQSQGLGGLVIEMGTLNTIHSFGPTAADVDAGLLWKDLLQTLVPQGLTPPALTGFTGLSIGGTLSVGGISSTFGVGAQVDHVQELEVVTGEGEAIRCSANNHRELFEAALARLGQCGIITPPGITLVPAPSLVRAYTIVYADSAALFPDFLKLLDRGELSELFNFGIPNRKGGFLYQLNPAAYFDPASPPDNPHPFRGP